MNIEGFSKKTIEELYDKFGVKTFSDIYKLDEEKLSGLDGFKDKKIANVLSGIENSKKVKLSNFIFALGIDNIGNKTAKQLSKIFGNLDALKNATIEDLVKIDDIALIVATGIYEFFNDELNLKEIDELVNNYLTIESDQTETSGGYFAGKKVVLTGTLAKYSRTEAEKLIESQGGVASSSVSKATDIVLVGENPGSKLLKAQKFGIKIMYEDGFFFFF